jgi:GR25 family glycosyltransferase involved in LPS biosynthesis
MEFFNKTFDKIYCINLVSRPDRKAHVELQFKKAGIEVEFIEAIEAKSDNEQFTDGMVGCFKSHRSIYESAIASGYESILIFEDDIQFTSGFEYLLKKANEQIPEGSDFLFYGFEQDKGLNGFLYKVNDFWVIPGTGWGCHAYAILNKQTLLNIEKGTRKMVMEIDRQFSNLVLSAYDIEHFMMIPPAVHQIDLGTNVQTHKVKNERAN